MFEWESAEREHVGAGVEEHCGDFGVGAFEYSSDLVELALPPLGGHLTRENVHMGNTRREFTPEYKDEAVKLVINAGRVIAYKARNDIGETGVTESERAELLRLRKENADLKLDRAFLKKASIFFAQEASDTSAKRSN